MTPLVRSSVPNTFFLSLWWQNVASSRILATFYRQRGRIRAADEAGERIEMSLKQMHVTFIMEVATYLDSCCHRE